MTPAGEPRGGSRGVRGLSLAGCILVASQCAACVYGRIVWFNVPSLHAPEYFDERVVRASPRPLPLRRRAEPVVLPQRDSRVATFASFDELLARNDTRALVIIARDEIVYERYFDGVTEETLLPCFSASKTFAAVLVGCAIADGVLPDVRAELGSVVPEAREHPGYADITLEQLLRMTSGIDFDEESTAGAVLFYTTDLRGRAFAYDVAYPPGRHYEYGSINMQIAWEALHARLGARTVASYFEERLWSPLGAERPAEWALDSASNGVEKLGSGFAATALDYARLGLLFEHRGKVGDRQVLPERWVTESIVPDEVAGIVDTTDGPVRHGRYQWFVTLDERRFYAKGFRGQYVYVDAPRDVVIVRFGEGYGDVDWLDLFDRIAATL